MATLHSLQHSHDSQSWFARCLSSVESGDGIILLEDAVTISCHFSSLKQLNALDKELSFYVIDVDLQARGLTKQFNEMLTLKLASKITVVSYQEFVELSLQYDKVVNWA